MIKNLNFTWIYLRKINLTNSKILFLPEIQIGILIIVKYSRDYFQMSLISFKFKIKWLWKLLSLELLFLKLNVLILGPTDHLLWKMRCEEASTIIWQSISPPSTSSFISTHLIHPIYNIFNLFWSWFCLGLFKDPFKKSFLLLYL